MTDEQILRIAAKHDIDEYLPEALTIEFARAVLAAGASEGQADDAPCPHCNGTGRMVRDPDIGTDQECFVCDGTGRVEQETPNPACSLSWNGFNVHGDDKSIREVRHIVNVAGRCAQLEAEIAALRERINAAASLNAIYADEIRDLRERIAGMEKDAARWRIAREFEYVTDFEVLGIDQRIDAGFAKEKQG